MYRKVACDFYELKNIIWYLNPILSSRDTRKK